MGQRPAPKQSCDRIDGDVAARDPDETGEGGRTELDPPVGDEDAGSDAREVLARKRPERDGDEERDHEAVLKWRSVDGATPNSCPGSTPRRRRRMATIAR